MNKNMVIVLTGVDGSGKTTQADLILESLKNDGIPVSYVWSRWKPFLLRPVINMWKQNISKDTKRSGGAEDYKKIKSSKSRLLRNPFFKWLWLTAFFLDYGIQIFFKIRLRKLNNKLILSDRMFHDSVIDQAINLGSDRASLLEKIDSMWMKVVFPQPDMVLYIDCPGEVAFSRKDDAPDVEYLIERRDLYLQLADKYGWVVIDGTLPIDAVASRIKDEIYRKIEA